MTEAIIIGIFIALGQFLHAPYRSAPDPAKLRRAVDAQRKDRTP